MDPRLFGGCPPRSMAETPGPLLITVGANDFTFDTYFQQGKQRDQESTCFLDYEVCELVGGAIELITKTLRTLPSQSMILVSIVIVVQVSPPSNYMGSLKLRRMAVVDGHQLLRRFEPQGVDIRTDEGDRSVSASRRQGHG